MKKLLVVGFEGATKVSSQSLFFFGGWGRGKRENQIRIGDFSKKYEDIISDIVCFIIPKKECMKFVDSKPSCYNHRLLLLMALEPRPAHIGPLVFRDGLVAQPVHHIGNPIGNSLEHPVARRLETEARLRRNG